MKLFLLLLAFLSVFNSIKTEEAALGNSNENSVHNELGESKSQGNSPSDIELQKIRNDIYSIAAEMIKSPNQSKKARGTGNFPSNYNVYMRNRGKDSRKKRSLWGFMMDVTEQYQFCINSAYKMNYKKIADNAYAGNSMKNDACKNSFCKVCCDQLPLMLSNLSRTRIIGEKLELSADSGERAIKTIVDTPTIDRCKSRCSEAYPISLPLARPAPERDPDLGKEFNPGKDCSDIKEWGRNQLPSGTYWIQTTKGLAEVYCDMDTEGGGWTMFLNYRHFPDSDFKLNGTKIPKNFKENSHVNLSNFFRTDRGSLRELRFECTEIYKKQPFYWHFKTTNPDLLKVAKNGNQEGVLRDTSLMSGYVEMRAPDTLLMRGYKKAVDKNEINTFRLFGTSQTGGFYDTPFGRSDKNWTIQGSDITMPRWECGSNHKMTDNYLPPEENPNYITTHHTVWFRGKPPSPEEVQERLAKRGSNK